MIRFFWEARSGVSRPMISSQRPDSRMTFSTDIRRALRRARALARALGLLLMAGRTGSTTLSAPGSDPARAESVPLRSPAAPRGAASRGWEGTAGVLTAAFAAALASLLAPFFMTWPRRTHAPDIQHRGFWRHETATDRRRLRGAFGSWDTSRVRGS